MATRTLVDQLVDWLVGFFFFNRVPYLKILIFFPLLATPGIVLVSRDNLMNKTWFLPVDS